MIGCMCIKSQWEHAHEELVGKPFYMVDLFDYVDMLHVKINKIVGMNLLGIQDCAHLQAEETAKIIQSLYGCTEGVLKDIDDNALTKQSHLKCRELDRKRLAAPHPPQPYPTWYETFFISYTYMMRGNSANVKYVIAKVQRFSRS